MYRNPFEAPAASSRPGKPVAVWGWMIVGSIVAVLVGLSLLRGILFAAMSMPLREGFALRILAAACTLVPIVCAMAGTHRRTQTGRILGLICIAGIFLYCLLAGHTLNPEQLQGLSPGRRDAEQAGAMLFQVLILPLIGWWFHAFGFSTRARDYFARPPRSTGGTSKTAP